jgi:hypothetical protein
MQCKQRCREYCGFMLRVSGYPRVAEYCLLFTNNGMAFISYVCISVMLRSVLRRRGSLVCVCVADAPALPCMVLTLDPLGYNKMGSVIPGYETTQ